MIRYMRVDLRTGLTHLRQCRKIAEPNCGFIVQLKAFESKELGKYSDLTGLNLGSMTTEEAKKAVEAKEEQMKADVKSLKDGLQQITIQKEAARKAQEHEDKKEEEPENTK